MNLHNAHVVEYLQEAKHWHNATLEADHWAAMGDIAPIPAAMLLCRFNPNAESFDDAKLTTTDELKPEHLIRLAQRLTDIDKANHRPRTLRDWYQTARDMGLKYHSWIEGYMEATAPRPEQDTQPDPRTVSVVSAIEWESVPLPESHRPPAPSVAGIARPAQALEPESPAMPLPTAVATVSLPKQRAQEARILQLLKEQEYDQSKLPTRAKGKRGVKSEIRAFALAEEPLIFSKNSFDKAWQRLRDGGEIEGGK